MIENKPDIILRPYKWKDAQFVAIYINSERTFIRADWSTIKWLADKLECELADNHEARNPEYWNQS